MPVIVKVLGALASILLINHLCRWLLVAVVGGALVLAVWCGHSAGAMAAIAWGRLASADNALLVLVVFQVIWLSQQMSESGVMRDLVGAVQARLSRRGAMAALPAVIGLLPMPGGALFSAPLVDRCDEDGSLDAALKTQTNHWFRHVWEYWWPLYPGILLALELTGLEIWQFMVVGVPLSLASIAAGYLFLLRRIEPAAESDRERTGRSTHSILSLLMPIIVVIGVYALVRGGHTALTNVWDYQFALNRYVPMTLGLFVAMVVLHMKRPLSAEQWKRIIFSTTTLNLVVIVVAVRVYGAFIEADLPNGTPLVDQMRVELAAAGIPLILMMMVIPFVSGLATGLAVGFVGASFPIVLSLLGPNPSVGVLISTSVLAYGFGYVGMLVSPVHVCLIVTSEYFQTRVLRNSAALMLPSLIILGCSVVLHFVYRALLIG